MLAAYAAGRWPIRSRSSSRPMSRSATSAAPRFEAHRLLGGIVLERLAPAAISGRPGPHPGGARRARRLRSRTSRRFDLYPRRWRSSSAARRRAGSRSASATKQAILWARRRRAACGCCRSRRDRRCPTTGTGASNSRWSSRAPSPTSEGLSRRATSRSPTRSWHTSPPPARAALHLRRRHRRAARFRAFIPRLLQPFCASRSCATPAEPTGDEENGAGHGHRSDGTHRHLPCAAPGCGRTRGGRGQPRQRRALPGFAALGPPSSGSPPGPRRSRGRRVVRRSHPRHPGRTSWST